MPMDETLAVAAIETSLAVGGRLVDRSPRPGRIYAAILVAALYLCGSVAVCEPVAFACLGCAWLAKNLVKAEAVAE